MNCEEYRQAIGADPSFDGGAGHLGECAACQAYRSEMLELDKVIGAALAISVPELQPPELPDVDDVVPPKRRRFAPPAMFAMAATVALAAFIGIRIIGSSNDYESLADQLLTHIDHEPDSLLVTDVPVSDARLVAVVPPEVARLDHGAGLITYAKTCPINGHDVPHLVLQGERGPVTLLLMPQEKVDAPQFVTGESVKGVILPVGDGSIAIFGERDENLERIEKRVMDSVTWST